uniref:uncharacterized protein n=1 Tax=Leptospirillum rubarum TaxID=419542 RepID=UPI0001CEA398
GHVSDRPAGRMPLTVHRNVGRWLSEILHASIRDTGVSSRIEFVRRTLHGWVREEYSETELPNAVYRNLYFPVLDAQPAHAGSGKIETISECDRLKNLVRNVTDTLVENYPQGLESEALLIALDGVKLELARIRKDIEMYGDPRKR